MHDDIVLQLLDIVLQLLGAPPKLDQPSAD